MDNKVINIDGNNFSDLSSFFNEIDRVLTKDLDWETGHNMNGFNDLLRGGFGVYDCDEEVILIWTNFNKSICSLGAQLVEDLVEIIEGHQHIKFLKID